MTEAEALAGSQRLNSYEPYKPRALGYGLVIVKGQLEDCMQVYPNVSGLSQ
jgi:hypothetical protein